MNKDVEYIKYCEEQFNLLFDILKKLKFKNHNQETVEWFLKERKIKQKKYLEVLDNLYSKCEFLAMRYSKDEDFVCAYKELNGDAQAGWFYNIAYQTFIDKKSSILNNNANERIEEIYGVPVHTARWMRITWG